MQRTLTYLNTLTFTAALIIMGISASVNAEIYKKVDDSGHITYSNVPLKGASKLNIEPPAPRSSTPRAKTPTPASFPKVSPKTQNKRNDKRKQILASELEAEKQALEVAKQAYIDGKANPEVFTAANGKRFRNVPKYQKKMEALQADIDAHQRNIDLLQKELNNL